jgi:hypothetical protein
MSLFDHLKPTFKLLKVKRQEMKYILVKAKDTSAYKARTNVQPINDEYNSEGMNLTPLHIMDPALAQREEMIRQEMLFTGGMIWSDNSSHSEVEDYAPWELELNLGSGPEEESLGNTSISSSRL